MKRVEMLISSQLFFIEMRLKIYGFREDITHIISGGAYVFSME